MSYHWQNKLTLFSLLSTHSAEYEMATGLIKGFVDTCGVCSEACIEINLSLSHGLPLQEEDSLLTDS